MVSQKFKVGDYIIYVSPYDHEPTRFIGKVVNVTSPPFDWVYYRVKWLKHIHGDYFPGIMSDVMSNVSSSGFIYQHSHVLGELEEIMHSLALGEEWKDVS